MYFTAGLAPRARLGEEPWLDEDEVWAIVVEDVVAVWESGGGGGGAATAGRFGGICGSSAGSGGGRGGLGVVPRRLPACFGRSKAEGTGLMGGEYCVPASTVAFVGVCTERGLLLGFSPAVGDCETVRGKAAGGGGLMYGRGDCVVENR
jgi:hypothetical protein